MKGTIILILTLLSFAKISMGQIDTAAIRIEGIENENLQKSEWLKSAYRFQNSDPILGIDHAKKSLSIALRSKEALDDGLCYLCIGELYLTHKNGKKAVKYLEDAEKIFDSNKTTTNYYTTIKHLGPAYELAGKDKKALEYYQLFERMADNEDDVVMAKNGIASTNISLGNIPESQMQYQQVFQIEQTRGNSSGYIQAATNLGNVYEIANDTVTALNYYDSSFNTAIQSNSSSGITNSFRNQNRIFAYNGNVEEQKKVNLNALNTIDIEENPTVFNEANYNLGVIELNDNNNKKAISYLNNTIQNTSSNGDIELLVKSTEQLAEAYKREGNYDEAVNSFERLLMLQDSLSKIRARENLESQELIAKLEAKDNDIELMKENINLREEKMSAMQDSYASGKFARQITIYALLLIILLLGITAIIIYRNNREKNKSNMLLELKSLRSQMNPHFIFNSLNSVNSFISKNDDRSANKYLTRFSQLMRTVLENSKHEFVSLGSEIGVIDLYVELEHLRFQDKFEYEFIKDISGDLEEIHVPPMLIQPYVENAVWHGLRYKDDKGKLLIKVSKNKSAINWTIEDNGIGRTRSKELKTVHQNKSESTGMSNIQSRLSILNKLNNTEMTALITDLEDNDGNPIGTRVEIEIPFIDNLSVDD